MDTGYKIYYNYDKSSVNFKDDIMKAYAFGNMLKR